MPTTTASAVHWTFTLYSAAGTKTRAYIAWEDADTTLFVEFDDTGTNHTMRLGRRTAGTEEYIGDPLTLDDADFSGRPTISICWTPSSSEPASSGIEASYATYEAGVDWSGGALGAPDTVGSMFTVNPTPDNTETLVLAMGFQGLPVGAAVTGISAAIYANATYINDENDTLLNALSAYVNDGVTGAVGDNKAAGDPTPINGDWGPVEKGGMADDWNASIDWIKARTLGIAFSYACDPGISTDIEVFVDAAVMTIWWEAPARVKGYLRASYHNTTGAMDMQCLAAHTETTSTGKKVGVASVSGIAEVDDLTYSYKYDSTSRPTCPDCGCDVETVDDCNCCSDGFPAAASYTLDLGDGGWTDNDCDWCDGVSGVYQVDADGPCRWTFTEDHDTCGGAFPGGSLLYIRLDLIPGTAPCRWDAIVEIPVLAGVSSPQYALYSSAELASTDDCQSTPVTLTKVWEYAGSGFCGGSLPDEIYLDIV